MSSCRLSKGFPFAAAVVKWAAFDFFSVEQLSVYALSHAVSCLTPLLLIHGMVCYPIPFSI